MFRWSLIAARLPGRTDNEIKNYWNTHIKRKLYNRGIDPQTHRPLNPTGPPPATVSAADFKSEPPVQKCVSAEDSNCSSGVTVEDVVYPEINLDLSIGLPFDLNQNQNKNQNKNQGSDCVKFDSSSPVGLCCNLGFQNNNGKCSNCNKSIGSYHRYFRF